MCKEEVQYRLDIRLQVEREGPPHLLSLGLVLHLLFAAIGASVGATLTSKLGTAVPAHINCYLFHLARFPHFV